MFKKHSISFSSDQTIIILDVSIIFYMTEEKIKIRLPNAREKLQPLFPQDNRGDIKIIFGKKIFKLQKAFLRLQSGFFKRAFSQSNDQLQIKQDFKEGYFTNVLKCFYGFTIEIPRNEIVEYYPIIKFLEVESLLKLLREDMTSRAESYDVFVLLQIAHRFNQQDLFQASLAQLDRENYEQLRYAKHQLLRCSTELFKMVVKTHNRAKADKGKGIQFLQIDQLIKEFGEQKKLGEAQLQELKFELIDKNSLSSEQYKQIFLDEMKRKKDGGEYRSMIKIQSPNLASSGFGNTLLSASKLTQSVIEPIKKINEQLTLQLQNTYEKKKNEELQAKNIYLTTELNELKAKSSDHSSALDSLKQLVGQLRARLEEKDRVDKEQSNIIKRLEKTCQDLKTEVTSRGQLIKKLEDRISKLEKQPQKRLSGNSKFLRYDEEEEDQSKTIQSQIVPGHLLKEIAKPAAEALNPPTNSGGFKKAKQVPSPTVVVAQAKIQQELDQQELEQMYSSRLSFDRQPNGCPKRYLPKLANFLTTDGFQKKKLNLLFRRTSNNQEQYGQSNDIRNRDSLLVLICTRLNQIIGGFTSIGITKNSSEYISDQNAFIFSLTKNQKFCIKKSHINEAIFISSDYLIGFSNDLMINIDCVKSQSECVWPYAYDSNGQKRTSRWLTGEETSFWIKSIEIYEVREEEMIMDL